MRVSCLWSTGVCVAVLSLAAVAQAAAVSASGTVLGTDGKPLSDVTISSALAKTTTITDGSGAWSLEGASTGIESRVAIPVANSRLMLQDGRLYVRFDGRDVSGRGQGRALAASRPSAGAARAADIPDTLLYTWNGKVRLRDTISVSRTGIVRTLDTTLNPSIVYGYLADVRDGQTYRTVKIGSQVWMAQNLNFNVDNSWWYSNSADNGVKYGRLYTWSTAMGLNDSCNTKSCASQVAAKRQGVCPSGWHVPSDAEWTKLTDTTLVKATAGTKLKATTGWSSTGNGTDEHGFTVPPAGVRNIVGSFFDFGLYANYWSASEGAGTRAWYRFFYFGDAFVDRYHISKSLGYSLRCLQD